ncbi:MAG: biotin transporter BioY [Candidatus Caldatribacteriota bacterium]
MNKISLRQITLSSLFAALTAAGAFISISLSPVPLSLQTFFTLLAGMTLGSIIAMSSQLIYVLLGVIGLPIFAGFRAGIGVLFGPTGGFLWGFIIAAYLMGKLVEYRKGEKSVKFYFLVGLWGTLVIYLLGILQLSLVTTMGIKRALMVGLVPFIPGDILKLIAASLVAYKLENIIK